MQIPNDVHSFPFNSLTLVTLGATPLVTTPLEIFSLISGIIAVYLVTVEHIAAWPLGIVNVAITATLLFQQHLYGDGTLQIIFFFLNIFGWWAWQHGKGTLSQRAKRVIHRCTAKELRLSILIFVLLVPLVYAYINMFTHADNKVFDTLTTAGSLVGTYQQTLKHIENWFVWIVIDAVYVYLYLEEKHLYLLAICSFTYIIFALTGYKKWSHNLKKSDPSPSSPLLSTDVL